MPFTLTPANLAHLDKVAADCAPFDPAATIAFELGRLMYAHLYSERCRKAHVAVLHFQADMALQRDWQANREAYVAQGVAAYEAERAATRDAGRLAA